MYNNGYEKHIYYFIRGMVLYITDKSIVITFSRDTW